MNRAVILSPPVIVLIFGFGPAPALLGLGRRHQPCAAQPRQVGRMPLLPVRSP